MTYRIDVLSTDDKDKLQNKWQQSITQQSQYPGFIDAKLHRVYKQINKTGYDFISICQWENDKAYHASFSDKSSYQYLATCNGKMKTNLYEICNGTNNTQEASVPGNLVVTNPYRINPNDADEYANMWNMSKDHMKSREGFVNANFYQQVSEDGDYYFVSCAEWRSEDLFMNQFSGKDFKKIVEPFENIFSICLSTVVSRS